MWVLIMGHIPRLWLGDPSHPENGDKRSSWMRY
jgi:hypothetical protein